jgi:hypothetical protein
MLRNIFFYIALLAVAAYALWRGGGPERSVAALFLAAAIATILVLPTQGIFHDVATGILLVDSALFLCLLAVAMRAERFWPLWMTALQGIAVAGHGAKAVNPHVIPITYVILLAFWGYPMVALLAIATWRHQRRLKKYGTERSWTRSWLPSHNPIPEGGANG